MVCPVSFDSGSIPACAGEPTIRPFGSDRLDRRVYPRVCGGAPCALKSGGANVCRVYPRVCGGAKRCSDACVTFKPGLSPRVRGSLCGCVMVTVPGWRVYPRVCGGAPRWRDRRRWVVRQGLSPRVRGSRSEVGTGYPVGS